MEIISKIFVILAVLAVCAYSQTTGTDPTVTGNTTMDDASNSTVTVPDEATTTDEMTTEGEGEVEGSGATEPVTMTSTSTMSTTSGSRKQLPTILAILAAPFFAIVAHRF